MSIDSLGGISSAFDQQSFGTEMASMNKDTINDMGSQSSQPAMDKETFGAAVVSKTLDYMNSGGSGSSEMAQTYDFSKNVLSGYMPDQGTLTDIKV